MVPYMGDISAGHSPAAIPTVTGAAASEGTNHAPHPVTTAAHAPFTTCAITHPTGIVTPHPTLTISPIDITHATMPQTVATITQ